MIHCRKKKIFGKVMQNPGLCTELLRRILPDLDIDHVEYPELQVTDLELSNEQIIQKLQKIYHLSPEEADKYLQLEIA